MSLENQKFKIIAPWDNALISTLVCGSSYKVSSCFTNIFMAIQLWR